MVGRSAAAVYRFLLNSGAGNGCQVPHKTIADHTGISLPTLRRCLPKLRDAGLVEWEQQVVEGGLQANHYRVVTPERVNTPAVKMTVPIISLIAPPRIPSSNKEVPSTSASTKEVSTSTPSSDSSGSAALRAAPGGGKEPEAEEWLGPVLLAP